MQVTTDNGQSAKLQLNIWDAAGEANVHDLAHLFLRDVQCGVLVFSIDSKVTFDALDEWKEHLENQNVLLVLVGNKSDLDQDRQVSHAAAMESLNDLGCAFYHETSSWNDLNSIKELFDEIGKKLVEKRLYQDKNGSTV